jgi:hypothetical protein
MDSDNTLRSYLPLYFGSDMNPDPARPNLDLAVLRQLLYGKAVEPTFDSAANAVKVGDLVIPLNMNGTVDVNYAGPPETVPTFPYHHVFYETMDMSVFKDKVVYIGATSDILHDNHRTPFRPRDQPMPGVETHVHFLDTMLTQGFIKHVPGWSNLLLILGLGLLTSFLTFRVNAKLGSVVMAIIFLAYGGFALWAFAFQNLIRSWRPLPRYLPAFATYRGIVEERPRARSSKYVSSRSWTISRTHAGRGRIKRPIFLRRARLHGHERSSARRVVEGVPVPHRCWTSSSNGGTLTSTATPSAVWARPVDFSTARRHAPPQMMKRQGRANWRVAPHDTHGPTPAMVVGNM